MHVRCGFMFLLLLASTFAGGRSHAQAPSLRPADPAVLALGRSPGESMSSSGLALPSMPLPFGIAPALLPLGRYGKTWPGSQQTGYALDEDKPVVAHTIGGAVLGAAVGLAILFAPSNCRSSESMCGAGIPLYVGAGAIGGGLIGYLIGSSTR